MRSSHRTQLAGLLLAAGALAGAASGIGTAFAATKTHHPATKKVAPAHVSGVISAVDAKADTLTVKVGKASDVFKTTASTAVLLAGKKSTLAELKKGEHAVVVYTKSGTVLDASRIVVAKA